MDPESYPVATGNGHSLGPNSSLFSSRTTSSRSGSDPQSNARHRIALPPDHRAASALHASIALPLPLPAQNQKKKPTTEVVSNDNFNPRRIVRAGPARTCSLLHFKLEARPPTERRREPWRTKVSRSDIGCIVLSVFRNTSELIAKCFE